MKKMWTLAAPLLLWSAVYAGEFSVGSKVADFQMEDLKGGAVSFSQVKGDVTVVTFISAQCPVSNAYNERMNALYSEYGGKGVRFVFLNANATEPAEKVAAHAAEHKFLFPVYKDPGNAVADKFGAMATPEAYVIGRDGTLLYHGSIDDSQNLTGVQNQWLKKALDATLAGQAVEKAETKAFGCSIKRVKKTT